MTSITNGSRKFKRPELGVAPGSGLLGGLTSNPFNIPVIICEAFVFKCIFCFEYNAILSSV